MEAEPVKTKSSVKMSNKEFIKILSIVIHENKMKYIGILKRA